MRRRGDRLRRSLRDSLTQQTPSHSSHTRSFTPHTVTFTLPDINPGLWLGLALGLELGFGGGGGVAGVPVRGVIDWRGCPCFKNKSPECPFT